jgi:hypothetical protein
MATFGIASTSHLPQMLDVRIVLELFYLITSPGMVNSVVQRPLASTWQCLSVKKKEKFLTSIFLFLFNFLLIVLICGI